MGRDHRRWWWHLTSRGSLRTHHRAGHHAGHDGGRDGEAVGGRHPWGKAHAGGLDVGVSGEGHGAHG